MTITRASLCVAGGTLLLAYLAAANSTPRQIPPPRESARAERDAPDALAAEVRAEADRLRARIASAPVPDVHPRNPFAFGAAPPPVAAATSAASAHAASVDAPPEVAAPPSLSLVGIAEDPAGSTTRRSAIITAAGDALFIVGIGDAVGDRYEVTAIGPDVVELRDRVTGGFRRLAMR